MAVGEPANRNLWIIAALVLVTVAALAWFLDIGGSVPGSDIAQVSVEAPPERDAAAGDTDSGLAGAVHDALAPPAAGPAAENN